MKRLLLVAVLAVATWLIATAPALAESAQKERTSAPATTRRRRHRRRPPPPPPPHRLRRLHHHHRRHPPSATPTVRGSRGQAFETASSSLQIFGTTRCKRQTFKQTFTQANLYSVMRYEGSFRVCYKHGQGIVSYSDVHGDMTWTRIPWEWRGNDTDYPHGIKYSRHVVFDYRGSAAFCVIPYACGPTKHPWVRIVFYDNNTLTRTLVSTRAIVLVVVAISVVVLVVIQIASGTLTGWKARLRRYAGLLGGDAAAGPRAAERGADELAEEWRRPGRPRLELRMELAGDEPGMVGELDDLHEPAPGGPGTTSPASSRPDRKWLFTSYRCRCRSLTTGSRTPRACECPPRARPPGPRGAWCPQDPRPPSAPAAGR